MRQAAEAQFPRLFQLLAMRVGEASTTSTRRCPCRAIPPGHVDASGELHLTKATYNAIMHVMHDSFEIGLRERKKLNTRNAIERAAVQIVLEQGYEAATAEAIAKRADVSLRTFFNYFPSKDVAIIGPDVCSRGSVE